MTPHDSALRPDLSAHSADELRGMVYGLLDLVQELRGEIATLKAEVRTLRDEVDVLKGHKPVPAFKGSGLVKKTNPRDDELPPPGSGAPKRPGSAKRSKTAQLAIHEERIVQPDGPLPEGSKFVGFRRSVVQDLRIEAHNTCYLRAVWRTPEGRYQVGPRPAGAGHFGPTLRAYVLYQHHHCHVTQPKLAEQLREWGVEVSAGQLNALLVQGATAFTAEKTAILTTGLQVSPVVTVDDSGARHAGANGYVLNGSSPLFAWFKSTASKSRTNFLTLLHASAVDYRINEAALHYMATHGLAPATLLRLRRGRRGGGPELSRLAKYMALSGVTSLDEQRIVTEGALWGALAGKVHPRLASVSDGASQFNVAEHGLCWVHAERPVHKLIAADDAQRAAQESARSSIWALFKALRRYQEAPQTATA